MPDLNVQHSLLNLERGELLATSRFFLDEYWLVSRNYDQKRLDLIADEFKRILGNLTQEHNVTSTLMADQLCVIAELVTICIAGYIPAAKD